EALADLLWADPGNAQLLAPDPVARSQRSRNLVTAARFSGPSAEAGLEKRIHRLLAPTLLIWGDQDRIVPIGRAEAFRSRLRYSRLELVTPAGHLPQFERPDQYSRFVGEFLDG